MKYQLPQSNIKTTVENANDSVVENCVKCKCYQLFVVTRKCHLNRQYVCISSQHGEIYERSTSFVVIFVFISIVGCLLLKWAVVTTYGRMMRLNWPKIIAMNKENNSEVMRPKWHLINASNLLNGISWPPKQTTDDLIEISHSCGLRFTVFTRFALMFLIGGQLGLGKPHTIRFSSILFK